METTTWTTKTTISTWVSLLKEPYAVTTEITQILEYSYSNFAINQLVWYISSISKFVHFIDPQNFVLDLLSNFVHFIHPYMNPLPKKFIYFFNQDKSISHVFFSFNISILSSWHLDKRYENISIGYDFAQKHFQKTIVWGFENRHFTNSKYRSVNMLRTTSSPPWKL